VKGKSGSRGLKEQEYYSYGYLMRVEKQHRNTSEDTANYIGEMKCVGHAAVESHVVVRPRCETSQALDRDSSIWSGGGSTGRRIAGTESIMALRK
jgi:hypothetical protein